MLALGFVLSVVFCAGYADFVHAEEQKIIITTEPRNELPLQEVTSLFERKVAYVADRNYKRRMNYYWFVPKPPYPDGVQFPLVVILHGSTGYSYAGKYLSEPRTRLKYPAFILVPMAPEGALWSYPEPVSNYSQELPHVVKLIADLKTQYPIDEGRIYVLGCSMGGYGVLGASAFYDDVFAAGVSISGEWYPSQAEQMTKMPMLIMAGKKDSAVPVHKTRAVVKALQRVGAPIEYVENDMGHNCPSRDYYRENLWEWLFSHRK